MSAAEPRSILGEALAPGRHGAGGGAPVLTAGNLSSYFAALGITRDVNDTAELADVLRGCHPELRPLEAVWLLTD